ncbi:hypothetical protein Angca_000879, partial [Angiostrongylus cantonensis]
KCLHNNEHLLDIYSGLFGKQLRTKILKEIIEEKTQQALRPHNISHPAVFTPNKNTAEVRIVYGTSAHYKRCLSLNDVSHYKPIILPKMVNFSVSLESV